MEQLAESGRDVPALRNRPRLDDWGMLAWGAFGALHRRRQAGLAANPLGAAEIRAFLSMYGFTGEAEVEMYELVAALDDAWLEWSRKRDNG